MPIIGVILILCLIGVGLYLINTFIPMDARFKTLIYIVAIILTILWLLQVFGINTGIHTVR